MTQFFRNWLLRPTRRMLHSSTRRLADDDRQRCLHGFSLIELLVVLAIMGVLFAMLIPALQAAREVARQAKCKNHLKQIGIALLQHHDGVNHFPYGGWGHAWVGVPGRGSGRNQPGGWVYGLLPHIEERALHELGPGPGRKTAYTQRMETPLPLFICPARRGVATWPVSVPHAVRPKPFGSPTNVARADYAINAGASHVLSFEGPVDLAQGDDPNFWKSNGRAVTDVGDFTGVIHLRTGVSLRNLEDGASNTYFVGEKHLASKDYQTGRSPGDNESMYAGYCTDLHRFTGIISPGADNVYLPPLPDDIEADVSELPGFVRFGAAHPSALQMAYCDGSVHAIAYDIDPEVHLRSGHRMDRGASVFALKLGL